jgi:hypothetical protein
MYPNGSEKIENILGVENIIIHLCKIMNIFLSDAGKYHHQSFPSPPH